VSATINHWISGREHGGTSERTGPVHNPATGAETGRVALASPDDVALAVSTAKEAARSWRHASLSQRAGVLFAFRELLHARSDELAAVVTAEHGKVLADAGGEVARGLENVEFATGLPHLLKGGFSEQASTGVDVYSIRQPLGVVAGITPFNFPAMVPLWMCANAIACGNAFILKPSEKDPSASLLLARWWKEAGLPDGVFTVLHGDKVAVDGLLTHPDVAALSFVGSTPIARHVYEAYGAAGERCMAVSVTVAVGDVGDRLVDAIAARLPKLRIGDGAAPDTDMGPLISAEHRDKVAGYIGAGERSGATVVVDGRTAEVPADGFFLGTTLLDRVSTDMEVYTDEIFGPVLSVLRVDDYAAAVRVINENPYANGTALFTRDGRTARQFQFDAEVGMVGINVPIPVPVAYYSFGGWRSSLFGDQHMYGPEGIAFYTRGKVVTSRWPEPTDSQVDLGFPRTR